MVTRQYQQSEFEKARIITQQTEDDNGSLSLTQNSKSANKENENMIASATPGGNGVGNKQLDSIFERISNLRKNLTSKSSNQEIASRLEDGKS